MEKICEKEFKTRKKNVLGRIFSHKSTNFTSLIFILAVALIFMPLANAATVRVQNGVLNISNNLLVSTNALFVDAANNKVGIGTTSPGIATTGAPALTVIGSSETLIEVGRSATISDGLRLGQYDFISTGQNPGNEQVGAIIGELQGNHSGTKGGRILFHTRSDGGGMTNRMTIDNAGNVGIGTLSPESTLDVRGTIKATSFVGDGSQLTNLPTATGSNSLWNRTGNSIHQSELGGNIGIGTSSPNVASSFGANDKVLSIRAGSDTAINRFGAVEIAGTASATSQDVAYMEFLGNAGATRLANFVVAHDGATNSGKFTFGTFNAGSFGNRMTIKSDGKVGIGTSSPSTTLDITGTLRSS